LKPFGILAREGVAARRARPSIGAGIEMAVEFRRSAAAIMGWKPAGATDRRQLAE
jgi:hypothetical protein